MREAKYEALGVLSAILRLGPCPEMIGSLARIAGLAELEFRQHNMLRIEAKSTVSALPNGYSVGGCQLPRPVRAIHAKPQAHAPLRIEITMASPRIWRTMRERLEPYTDRFPAEFVD